MVKLERFENWSRTTLARILRVTLSMPRAATLKITVNTCTCKYFEKYLHKNIYTRINIHVHSMICTVRSISPSTMVSIFLLFVAVSNSFCRFQALKAQTDRGKCQEQDQGDNIACAMCGTWSGRTTEGNQNSKCSLLVKDLWSILSSISNWPLNKM